MKLGIQTHLNNQFLSPPVITVDSSLSPNVLDDKSLFLSQNFTLIVFNYLESPALQRFVGQVLQFEGQIYLTTKKKRKGSQESDLRNSFFSQEQEYFLLFMVNDNTDVETDQKLRNTLISLISITDRVVVYELENEKEAFIEKIFFESVGTCHRINWEFSQHCSKLIFVKEVYADQSQAFSRQTGKQTLSQMSMLQYFGSLEQLEEQEKSQKQLLSGWYKKHLFVASSSLKYVYSLLKIHGVFRQPSLSDLLKAYKSIYCLLNNQICIGTAQQQSLQVEKKIQEPWKVRYNLEKICELQTRTRFFDVLEKEIFFPSSKDTTQQVRKEILKFLQYTEPKPSFEVRDNGEEQLRVYQQPFILYMPLKVLTPKMKNKLLWKMGRLDKFESQIRDQTGAFPASSQNKLLSEVSDREFYLWIERHHARWLENSLKYLKEYFNRIANDKDQKAIQEFRQECFKFQDRLRNVDSESFGSLRQEKLGIMASQLRQFAEYHYDVLDGKKFSGFQFFLKQARYVVKNQSKTRRKIIIFCLIVILAMAQKNVIAGITIATLALIVLAIRL